VCIFRSEVLFIAKLCNVPKGIKLKVSYWKKKFLKNIIERFNGEKAQRRSIENL